MPRPKLKPTQEERTLVKTLAAVGIAQEDIAHKIGVRSPKTLRKHFREELDLGQVDANATIAGALYKKAKDGDVDAQKFWLIYRAGWGRGVSPARTTPAEPPPFIIAGPEKQAA